jgi:pyridoxal phosphate enzyme (YggS family)
LARAALISIEADRVRGNLEEVRGEIARAAARAGREAGGVEIVAATKYVASEDLPALAAGGIRLVGENRAQDLRAKVALHGELFAWDFIGQLQSRRVPLIVPHVRLIHSLASESAARALARCLEGGARPDFGVLVQVNVARETGKAGVLPEDLDGFLGELKLPVRGLMAMPPAVADAELNRPWFSALRELAVARGLAELSMGTTQDYAVAVEEGATILRIGTRLYV